MMGVVSVREECQHALCLLPTVRHPTLLAFSKVMSLSANHLILKVLRFFTYKMSNIGKINFYVLTLL